MESKVVFCSLDTGDSPGSCPFRCIRGKISFSKQCIEPRFLRHTALQPNRKTHETFTVISCRHANQSYHQYLQKENFFLATISKRFLTLQRILNTQKIKKNNDAFYAVIVELVRSIKGKLARQCWLVGQSVGRLLHRSDGLSSLFGQLLCLLCSFSSLFLLCLLACLPYVLNWLLAHWLACFDCLLVWLLTRLLTCSFAQSHHQRGIKKHLII